jgi:hypothetical protein
LAKGFIFAKLKPIGNDFINFSGQIQEGEFILKCGNAIETDENAILVFLCVWLR